LQIWMPLLEHWVAPGVQPVVHVPELHVLAQGPPEFCQVPLPSHACGCCPLHCVAPGVHAPVQAAAPRRPASEAPASAVTPPAHTNGQVAPWFCQLPVASQVCCCWPWQRLVPGVHEPEQPPSTHVCPLHDDVIVV
jgi:hypothetical protein